MQQGIIMSPSRWHRQKLWVGTLVPQNFNQGSPCHLDMVLVFPCHFQLHHLLRRFLRRLGMLRKPRSGLLCQGWIKFANALQDRAINLWYLMARQQCHLQPQASATRDLTLTAPAERDFFNKEKPPDLEMTHFHCDMVGAGKARPFIVIIVLKDGCLVWPLHISLNKTRRSNQC